MSAPLHVLGPQRPDPNVPEVLGSVDGDGPVVLISAGWRYEETDAPSVLRRFGRQVVHLPLYAWFEELRRTTPSIDAIWRERQSQILAFKQCYQIRMRSALEAVEALHALPGADSRTRRAELEDAIFDVRRLDARVEERTAAIVACYPEVIRPWEHPAVRPMFERAMEVLGGARAVLVAGGHVGVLANRLAFFGVPDLIADAHRNGAAVIAWSAGAMALSRRVVLFYDDPPEGPSWPELFDRGTGLLPGAVFLPHARRRLRLGDRRRVASLAQRFGPEPCIGLELGAWLSYEDGCWRSRGRPETALWLTADGDVVPWESRHG